MVSFASTWHCNLKLNDEINVRPALVDQMFTEASLLVVKTKSDSGRAINLETADALTPLTPLRWQLDGILFSDLYSGTFHESNPRTIKLLLN
jgi:hypothetical protein